MKRVLYFPFMNLPVNCPALGSALLFAEEINIIAPYNARIEERRTLELLDSGLIRRIDPSIDLNEKNFKLIEKYLNEFLELNVPPTRYLNRNARERGFAEINVHPDKFGRLIELHNDKLSNGIIELLERHRVSRWENGNLVMSEDVGMYLLGLIAKEIKKNKNLSIISSVPFHSLSDNIENKVIAELLCRIQMNLMPTLAMQNLDVREIVNIKREYGVELNRYVSQLNLDLSFIVAKSLNNLKARDRSDERLVQEIVEDCRCIEDEYERNLRGLEKHINSVRIYRIERSVVGQILPTFLSFIPVIGSVMAGFLRFASLAIPDNQATPSKLAKQQVILNINNDLRNKQRNVDRKAKKIG